MRIEFFAGKSMNQFTIKNKQLSRWLWFIGLYVLSIMVVGGFVFGMRLLLGLHA